MARWNRLPLIERILCESDPQGLLAIGAPDDQYSGLAKEIAARWVDGMAVEALARVVEDVWVEGFDVTSSMTPKVALEIASRLAAAPRPN